MPAIRGRRFHGSWASRRARAGACSGQPEGFRETLGELPGWRERHARRAGRDIDVIVAFFTRRSELEKRLPKLMDALDVDGGLWISWPKRSSGVETDITEDTLREVGLPLGLVDNKVCAIDETWSGLRLVYRKENRDAVRRAPDLAD